MIYWSGILVVSDRKILTVREFGKSYFALPGGSKKDGETILETLNREIREELSIEINFPLDHYVETELSGKGENEIIHFNLYQVDPKYIVSSMKIGEDIEEYKWINNIIVDHEQVEVGHLLEQIILPDLKSKNLID